MSTTMPHTTIARTTTKVEIINVYYRLTLMRRICVQNIKYSHTNIHVCKCECEWFFFVFFSFWKAVANKATFFELNESPVFLNIWLSWFIGWTVDAFIQVCATIQMRISGGKNFKCLTDSHCTTDKLYLGNLN